MEQHPVPRNVTSFQFHLIGDMTLRQFGYLAGGIFCGYLIYKSLPMPGAIKVVTAGLFALTGAAFAFLPIQERPLDKWLMAFIKSIYSPTQYLWHKNSHVPEILSRQGKSNFARLPPTQLVQHTDASEKLHKYLSSLPTAPSQKLNLSEKHYIDQTLNLFNATFTPPTSLQSQNIPSQITPVPTFSSLPTFTPPPAPDPLPKSNIEPPKEEELSKPQLQTSENNFDSTGQVPLPQKIIAEETVVPAQDHHELQSKLEELIKEKERLLQELASLKKDALGEPKSQVEVPAIKTFIPKTTINQVGIPNFPQVPNYVTGIVKDMQDRLLPNIIITIKNDIGITKRALKTNKLGQFASATSMENGTYLIEAEDSLKRYVFDVAQITLDGKVLPPLQILAKGQKEIMREKLTKEIFGNTL